MTDRDTEFPISLSHTRANVIGEIVSSCVMRHRGKRIGARVKWSHNVTSAVSCPPGSPRVIPAKARQGRPGEARSDKLSERIQKGDTRDRVGKADRVGDLVARDRIGRVRHGEGRAVDGTNWIEVARVTADVPTPRTQGRARRDSRSGSLGASGGPFSSEQPGADQRTRDSRSRSFRAPPLS